MGKSLAEARSSVVKLGREIVSAYRDYQDAYKKEFEFHPERMSKNSLPAGFYDALNEEFSQEYEGVDLGELCDGGRDVVLSVRRTGVAKSVEGGLIHMNAEELHLVIASVVNAVYRDLTVKRRLDKVLAEAFIKVCLNAATYDVELRTDGVVGPDGEEVVGDDELDG